MEEKKEHEAKHEHQEHHVHHVKHKKKTNIWMYASVVLVILLAVSLYFNLGSSSGDLSSDKASDKFMSFVNNNLLESGMTADLKNVKEANGVYEMELDVGGQSFVSYITKDAEIFFPQGYVIADLEEELSGAASAGEVETAAPISVKSDVPNVKMFVMSFCPYGQQAENGLGPALDVLGDSVEFEPHFVIYSDYASRMGASWDAFCWDEEEKYCSMHGIGELNEDIRQLCIYDQNPGKWWDYVNGINAECDYTNVDTCWENVAEDVGLDVSKIKTCFDEKGELFLKKEVLLNQQYGVQGSPTVLINDQPHNGGRAPENYKQSICSAFNDAPEECGEALSTTGAAATGDCG
ncbi:hypothetical protein KY306_02235 [Candidatus Woesearchaeota archaeon]|nr:hypothetical protein [Candidatus Woesearchaeota archaeon]